MYHNGSFVEALECAFPNMDKFTATIARKFPFFYNLFGPFENRIRRIGWIGWIGWIGYNSRILYLLPKFITFSKNNSFSFS